MSGKIIILIGPMGCGKTTIGKLLAGKAGYTFADADDYHPEVNKEKMGRGTPLNDSDREPWLRTLRDVIELSQAKGEGLVLACSALKKTYRTLLGIDQIAVHSVYLQGSYELLKERISARSHEFMSTGLLKSQLETLEEPETGVTVDIAMSPELICQHIINTLKI